MAGIVYSVFFFFVNGEVSLEVNRVVYKRLAPEVGSSEFPPPPPPTTTPPPPVSNQWWETAINRSSENPIIGYCSVG